MHGPNRKKVGYVPGTDKLSVSLTEADVEVTLFGSFMFMNWFTLSFDETKV